MVNNAVQHYHELREQDVRPSDALAHAAQRFGIRTDVLKDRVNGKVADPEATRKVLAEVKSIYPWFVDDQREDLLVRLYESVTGEAL